MHCTRLAWLLFGLVAVACSGHSRTLSQTSDHQTSTGQQPEAVPPFGLSHDEFASLQACLDDRGFAVDLEGEIVVADVPPEQASTFREGMAACSALVFATGSSGTGDSEQELSDWYDVLLEIKACLEVEGYEVPGPPTREVFVEDPSRWHPYNEIIPAQTVSSDEWRRLNMVCPQR